MKQLIAILAAGLIAAPAQAEIKTFTWVNPIARVDGTPFDAATEQAQTNVYCIKGAVNVEALYVSIGIAETLAVDFVAGSYTCTAATVDTSGLESSRTNSVSFVIAPSVSNPNPPNPLGVN